jgi:hypothetical protein
MGNIDLHLETREEIATTSQDHILLSQNLLSIWTPRILKTCPANIFLDSHLEIARPHITHLQMSQEAPPPILELTAPS